MGIVCNRCRKNSNTSNCVYSLRSRNIYECNECYNSKSIKNNNYDDCDIQCANTLTSISNLQQQIQYKNQTSKPYSWYPWYNWQTIYNLPNPNYMKSLNHYPSMLTNNDKRGELRRSERISSRNNKIIHGDGVDVN
jgi:hypothetical protein